MKFTKHTGGVSILENKEVIITQPNDILDIIGNAGNRTVIINKEVLHKDFFELKTRFAGEMLQKISNYNMKLGIVGDFSEYNSTSLKAFIYESNKGKQVVFTASKEEAIKLFNSSI